MDNIRRLSQRLTCLCAFGLMGMIILSISGMATEFPLVGVALRLSGVVPVLCLFGICMYSAAIDTVPCKPRGGTAKAVAILFGILLIPMALNVYLAFSAHGVWAFRMSLILWIAGVAIFCLGASPKKEELTIRRELR